MLLLMGAFAVYAGWLYNDFFSLGLDAFGSKWAAGDTAACDAQKAARLRAALSEATRTASLQLAARWAASM